MLPRSKRISVHLFRDIMQKGEVFHSTNFVLRRLKNDKKGGFAVSVPKKVAKTAVERNNLRRRFYSVIQEIVIDEFANQNIVIIAHVGSSNPSFSEIKDEVYKIFVKCGLLK